MLNKEIKDIFYSHYKNTTPPTTVEEYIANYPKGYGRTAIKAKFNITVKELLAELGYVSKKLTISERLSLVVEKFKTIEIMSYTGSTIKKCIVKYRCTKCDFIDEVTLPGLELRKHSCPNCEANSAALIKTNKLRDRLSELNLSTDSTEYSIKSRITVTCNNCYLSYKALVVKLLHPGSENEYKCPNCSENTVKIYEGIKFDSYFEIEIYKELNKKFTEIAIKVKYSDLAKCEKRWIADFLINNTIIEVTNFKRNNPKNNKYFDNLTKKQEWCLANGIRFIIIENKKDIMKI